MSEDIIKNTVTAKVMGKNEIVNVFEHIWQEECRLFKKPHNTPGNQQHRCQNACRCPYKSIRKNCLIFTRMDKEEGKPNGFPQVYPEGGANEKRIRRSIGFEQLLNRSGLLNEKQTKANGLIEKTA